MFVANFANWATHSAIKIDRVAPTKPQSSNRTSRAQKSRRLEDHCPSTSLTVAQSLSPKVIFSAARTHRTLRHAEVRSGSLDHRPAPTSRSQPYRAAMDYASAAAIRQDQSATITVPKFVLSIRDSFVARQLGDMYRHSLQGVG